MTDDIIERAEAALAVECGCNQSDCGWADLELGEQAREFVPELVAELKATRAEIDRIAARLGITQEMERLSDDFDGGYSLWPLLLGGLLIAVLLFCIGATLHHLFHVGWGATVGAEILWGGLWVAAIQ